MGNWRTVNMIGTCAANELDALRAACAVDENSYKNFHCLSTGSGLCGLGNWPAEEISAIGNLAERDYSVEAVASQLRELVKVAPSLSLTVHCGDDYESKTCVATIRVENGNVVVDAPEVRQLMAIPEGQMQANLLKALGVHL